MSVNRTKASKTKCEISLSRSALVAAAALAALSGSSRSYGQTTTWVGPATGNWSAPGNWDNGLPNSGAFTARVDNGNIQNTTVNIDTPFTVGTLIISSGDKVSINNNQSFTLGSALVNSGTFVIGSTSNSTDLYTGGSVSLTGSGTLFIQNSSRMRGAGTWNNASHVVGFGQLGINESSVINSGSIIASGGSLDVDPAAAGGLVNSGTLSAADATSALNLNGNAGGGLTNTGTILANGGVVTLYNGFSASGGTLTTLAGGSIALTGNSGISTFTNSGNIVVPNNNSAGMGGTVNNTGSINLASTVNTTDLYVNGATFSGGGSVNLANGARLRGGGALTNVNNTIRGFGAFGINELGITNSGTILATGGTLDVDPAPAGGLVNSSMLIAAASSSLNLNGNGGGGLVNTGTVLANGGVVSLYNGFSASGGTFTTLAGGSIALTGNSGISTFTNSGNIVVPNNNSVGMGGTVNNVGSINLASTANATDLYVNGATFSGGGSVNLVNFGRLRGTGTFVNVNNTIHGQGELGLNELAITNQSAGTIAADVSGGLLNIDSNSAGNLSNAGVLVAKNGGILQINGNGGGDVLQTATGIVRADNGSEVRLVNSGRISGGTITTTGTGSIDVASSHTAFLDALTNTGNVVVNNSAALDVSGTITNNGSININATVNSTDLVTNSATVSLLGSGFVSMQPNARIRGTNFLNVGSLQTIHGAGSVGANEINGGLNSGTISADLNNGTQAFSLVLDPTNTFALTNNGTMQAVSGGILVFTGNGGGTFANNSRIIAGNNSAVQLTTSATIAGGSFSSVGNGTFVVSASDNAGIVNLTNAGSIIVNNNATLYIGGTLVNNGSISLAATVNTTDLSSGGASIALTGSGTVTMNNGARIRGGGTMSLGPTLTVHGTGNIGANDTVITNAGTISADNSGTSLTLDPVNGTAFANSGTMLATGGGNLVLTGNGGGTFLNSTRIIANTASSVQLATSASVTGGSFNSVGTGTIFLNASDNASLSNLTLAGNVIVGNNATLFVGGTLTNNGSLTIASTVNSTDLSAGGGSATLAGTGTINLVNGARIRGGTINIGSSLTVHGVGNIGANDSVINNAGFITADTAGGTLVIDPTNTVSAFVSTGTLAALNGGILQLNGNGGGNFVSTGGAIAIANTGTFHTYNSASVAAGTVSLDGAWYDTDSASVSVTNVRGGGSLNISNSGYLAVNANGGNAGASKVAAVVTSTSGRLDLTNNDLIVDYTGASPLQSIRTQIGTAFGSGNWNGNTGITTSKGQTSPNPGETAKTQLGYGEASVIQSGNTVFDGLAFTGDAVLIKYTYAGDTNLDGKVDIVDLGRLASKWQQTGVWTDGDFNYDGTVNIVDLGILAASWQAGVGAPLGPDADFSTALAALGLPSVGVPEPTTSVSLIALAATGALATRVRRRRRSQPA